MNDDELETFKLPTDYLQNKWRNMLNSLDNLLILRKSDLENLKRVLAEVDEIQVRYAPFEEGIEDKIDGAVFRACNTIGSLSEAKSTLEALKNGAFNFKPPPDDVKMLIEEYGFPPVPESKKSDPEGDAGWARCCAFDKKRKAREEAIRRQAETDADAEAEPETTEEFKSVDDLI